MLVDPVVRLAQPTDALAIARLSRDTIETGLRWSWRPSRVLHAIADEDTNVAVVKRDARLIAFGIMTYGEASAHLSLLAVHPSYRREGLGSQVVGWLERCAQMAGLARVRLEARADNPGALTFYVRLGYRMSGQVPSYYDATTGAVRLEKVLAGAA